MAKRYPGGFRARRTRNEATLLLPYPRASPSLRRSQRRPALAGEDDPGRDREPTRDLHGGQSLVEEEESNDRSEKRLQVGEDRGPRGADLVDGREPQQVREHERAHHGEGETDPGERPDVEVLVAELRRGEQQERDGHDTEEDGAQPERRVAAHERRDDDGVSAPGCGAENGEQVAAEVRGDALPGAGGDEHDAREREPGRDPEPPSEPLDPDEARDERGEDRQRPEQESRGGGGRQVEREDEAQLVDEQ